MFKIIGELINTTRKKVMEATANRDAAFIQQLAKKQIEAYRPAEQFGESDQRGRIAAGLQADLVVLKGDISTNIRSLAAVEYTLRAGEILYRATD